MVGILLHDLNTRKKKTINKLALYSLTNHKGSDINILT